jgi:hypothetical protein
MSTKYRSCSALKGVSPVKTGTAYRSVMIQMSCRDLVNSGMVTGTIDWNTGRTSAYRARRLTSDALLAIVNAENGTITGGLFKDDDFTQVQTGPSMPFIRCMTKHTDISSLEERTLLLITRP